MANSRFWGFVFGLAAGVVIGALQAPQSGAETRARIKGLISDSTDQALDKVGLTEDKRHEIQHTVSDVRAKTASEVSTMVDKTTAALDRTARQVDESAATVENAVSDAAAQASDLADQASSAARDTLN